MTQAFNTSTSMGRLTLNVLLSFAQFEREVTAERIRDKIAASKKKGLWMGGLAPLGYDADPDPNVRGLVVNPAEAGTVHALFALYDDLGCLRRVEDEAQRRGLRSKLRQFPGGRTRGDARLSRGMIHHLPTNPVYLGRIRHKDRVWPGQHTPIIEEALWDRVQAKLQLASARPRGRSRQVPGAAPDLPPASLTGKLRDETGDRLTPSHTSRQGRRLRYYVSHRLLKGPDAAAASSSRGWRLPALALERTIADLIADHLEVTARGRRLLDRPDVQTAAMLSIAVGALATSLRSGDPMQLRNVLTSGRIDAGTISLNLDRRALADALGVNPEALAATVQTIEAPFQCRRRGIETRIVAGTRVASPDPILRRALIDANRWATAHRAGTQMAEIARLETCTDSYVRRRLCLAFLSPALQTAILDGTQPADLSLQRLLHESIPLDWTEQAKRFGLSA